MREHYLFSPVDLGLVMSCLYCSLSLMSRANASQTLESSILRARSHDHIYLPANVSTAKDNRGGPSLPFLDRVSLTVNIG